MYSIAATTAAAAEEEVEAVAAVVTVVARYTRDQRAEPASLCVRLVDHSPLEIAFIPGTSKVIIPGTWYMIQQ